MRLQALICPGLLDTAAEPRFDRLAQLINDLPDIEKLAIGKMPFDIQPLPVQEEIQQAIDNLQPFAGQHQVVFELQQIAADVIVLADSLLLQQVLTNLLTDAIKFSLQQMGGTIGFNSEPAKGSTFCFSLTAKVDTIS